MVDTVINRRTTTKYSRVVSREEIRENDYNLNIPRYVDSFEVGETWDILWRQTFWFICRKITS